MLTSSTQSVPVAGSGTTSLITTFGPTAVLPLLDDEEDAPPPAPLEEDALVEDEELLDDALVLEELLDEDEAPSEEEEEDELVVAPPPPPPPPPPVSLLHAAPRAPQQTTIRLVAIFLDMGCTSVKLVQGTAHRRPPGRTG